MYCCFPLNNWQSESNNGVNQDAGKYGKVNKYILYVSGMMMEALRTSETSVDNYFTRQYNPEDSSEQVHFHYRLRSHIRLAIFKSVSFRILKLELNKPSVPI
jgi:hypothetical protein